MTAVEEWQPIALTGGRYDASSLGRIRKMFANKHSGPGYILRQTWNPLIGCGYFVVGVYGTDGEKVTLPVHELIADAFLGKRPDDKVTNHKDTDTRNNRPDNLEHVTQRENVHHAIAWGRTARGETHGLSILTESAVRQIREARGKLTKPQAAEKFGVSEACIYDVWAGRRWKHVA